MEGDFTALTNDGIPNPQGRDPEIAKGVVRRNDLRLRRGVRDASLPFASSGNGESRVRSLDMQVSTGSRT